MWSARLHPVDVDEGDTGLFQHVVVFRNRFRDLIVSESDVAFERKAPGSTAARSPATEETSTISPTDRPTMQVLLDAGQ